MSVGAEQNPSTESVREHLNALLASTTFQASARRRQLLTYIVEQTLVGNGGRLKGFDIAVAVLGRDETFDPQIDPIVRVEVGKLRKELEAYYHAATSAAPVRIEIPRGRYEALFHAVPTPTDRYESPHPLTPVIPSLRDPKSSGRRRLFFGATLALLLGAALSLVRFFWPAPIQDRGPALIVMDFSASSEAASPLAVGLTNALVTDLMGFDGLQVFLANNMDGQTDKLPPALSNVPVYSVTGNVDRGANDVRTVARLADQRTGRVIWSRSYIRPLTTFDFLSMQETISSDIASRLAQAYGLISRDTRDQIAHGAPPSLFAYECVQRAFEYRRTFAAPLYADMRGCLEEAVKKDPGYADAWAMLAFARLDSVRLQRLPAGSAKSEVDGALVAARRAVELAPERARPMQALAAVYFMTGDYGNAETIQRRVIAMNPANPESLAQLGWRLAVRGEFEEAISLLSEAVRRSLVAPSWYYTTLALAYFGVEDLDNAYAEAQRGEEFCCGLGKAILAIMAAEAGHQDVADRALRAAKAEAPLLGSDPVEFWKFWQVDESLITRLNIILTGIDQASAK